MALLDGLTPQWGNYAPASMGWDENDIVPYSYQGIAFPGGVQEITIPIWNALLDAIVPLIPGGIGAIPDDWGANPASVTVGGTKSFHAYGIALDINATQNPMISKGSAPHTIPDEAGQIARSLGIEWGGFWTQPVDYMHFELHLSPAEANILSERLAAGQEPDASQGADIDAISYPFEALDYSAARLPGHTIREHGYPAVLRYLWFPGQRHPALTVDEVASLHADGVGIGLIFESAAARAGQGWAAGVADANTVAEQLNVLGAQGQCVYFTVDFDASHNNTNSIKDYFAGARTVLGNQVCGYAEYDVIDYLLADGLIRYGWQTRAWSGGRWHPGAVIRQHTLDTRVGTINIGVDLNTVLGPAGLWGLQGGDMALNDHDIARLVEAIKYQVLASNDWRFDGRNPIDIALQTLANTNAALVDLAELMKRAIADVDETALAEALVATGIDLGGADIGAIKTAIQEIATKAVQDIRNTSYTVTADPVPASGAPDPT